MTEATCASETRRDFIEKMGLAAQGEGLPRSAGRIFALLVFDGTQVPFGALAESLRISRGNVSGSIRLLEERGLVRRIGKSGDRQDYFEIAPDAFDTMLRAARRRVETVRVDIAATITDLPPDQTGPRRRLQDYADFYRAIEDGLDLAVSRLQHRTKQET